MKNINLKLENTPGILALMGEILGKNRISLEGGGVFNMGDFSIANFLMENTKAAKIHLEEVGIETLAIQQVLILKLRQDVPGQLGEFCKTLADADINILVQYSDHANQLILVVDKHEKGEIIIKEWMKKWWNK